MFHIIIIIFLFIRAPLFFIFNFFFSLSRSSAWLNRVQREAKPILWVIMLCLCYKPKENIQHTMEKQNMKENCKWIPTWALHSPSHPITGCTFSFQNFNFFFASYNLREDFFLFLSHWIYNCRDFLGETNWRWAPQKTTDRFIIVELFFYHWEKIR